MNISENDNCFSAEVQAHIETLPITLIKMELDEERSSKTIKVKMQRNLAMVKSEI